MILYEPKVIELKIYDFYVKHAMSDDMKEPAHNNRAKSHINPFLSLIQLY